MSGLVPNNSGAACTSDDQHGLDDRIVPAREPSVQPSGNNWDYGYGFRPYIYRDPARRTYPGVGSHSVSPGVSRNA